MPGNSAAWWKRWKNNIRNRLLSGTLLLLPFGVTLLVMRWLFGWLAGFLSPLIRRVLAYLARYPVLEDIPPLYVSIIVSVVSILLLLTLLYLVGVFARFVVAKRVIAAGETLLLRIPLVRTVYAATQQVMKAVSLPERSAFKSVVLVEFPRPGFKAVGFLTGHINGLQGRRYARVFIPTTPNPTSGFLELIPADQVLQTSWTIEEAFKMIISGGLVAPDTFLTSAPPPPSGS